MRLFLFLCISSGRFFTQVSDNAGPAAFRVLLFNVIVGNQIVVRGRDPDIAVSALSYAQQLLPNECLDVVHYDSVYHDSYQFKFLGLPPEIDVPDYVDSKSYAVVGAFVCASACACPPAYFVSVCAWL